MIPGIAQKPVIIENPGRNYVIIGSMGHGQQIPKDAVPELINSLKGVSAFMLEAKEFDAIGHPLSTEIIVKVSAGNAPIEYLPGTGPHDDIGELVLKYAPRDIAEVYVPFLCNTISNQLKQKVSVDATIEFIEVYKQRFSFIDTERALGSYLNVLNYWCDKRLNPYHLDDFSSDFQRFVGRVREFELWKPELEHFRAKYSGKVAVCCGAYHVQFIQSVFEGKEQIPPNWETHIDTDTRMPHSDSLKEVYAHIETALNGK